MSWIVDGQTPEAKLDETLTDTLPNQIVSGLVVSAGAGNQEFVVASGICYITNKKIDFIGSSVIGDVGDTVLWIDINGILFTGTEVEYAAVTDALRLAFIVVTPATPPSSTDINPAPSTPKGIEPWVTSGRPATPFIGQTGFNKDFSGIEVYQEATGRRGWTAVNGCWSLSNRPTSVLAGSRGFNYELGAFESLDDFGNWVS